MKLEMKEKRAKKIHQHFEDAYSFEREIQKNKHNTKLQWNPLDAFMATKTNPLLALNEF